MRKLSQMPPIGAMHCMFEPIVVEDGDQSRPRNNCGLRACQHRIVKLPQGGLAICASIGRHKFSNHDHISAGTNMRTPIFGVNELDVVTCCF